MCSVDHTRHSSPSNHGGYGRRFLEEQVERLDIRHILNMGMVKQHYWFLFTPFQFIQNASYIGVLTALIITGGLSVAPKGMGMGNSQQRLIPSNSKAAGLLLSQNTFSPPLLQFGSEGPEVQTIQSLLRLLGYYTGQLDGRYQESTVIAVSAFQSAAGLNEDGILGPTTWDKLLPSVSQIRSSVSASPLATAIPPSVDLPSSSPSIPPDEPQVDDSNPPSSESSSTANSDLDDVTSVASPTASPSEAEDISLPTLRGGMRGPAVRNLQERLNALGLLQGTIDGVFGDQTEESVKSAQRYFNLTPDGIVGPATWRALLQ